MDDTKREQLQLLITELHHEHRDLDLVINTLQAQPQTDQLQIRRLKKRKLSLRDRIELIESQLIPDLNA
ncbi:MAG: YdcH family protein [Granulosicoccaceae bacterium]